MPLAVIIVVLGVVSAGTLCVMFSEEVQEKRYTEFRRQLSFRTRDNEYDENEYHEIEMPSKTILALEGVYLLISYDQATWRYALWFCWSTEQGPDMGVPLKRSSRLFPVASSVINFVQLINRYTDMSANDLVREQADFERSGKAKPIIGAAQAAVTVWQ